MNADTLSILRHYPQIYLACHVDHVRKRSTAFSLSERDSSILAHLSQNIPISAATLARHLGVRPSTLSAALKRLRTLGYVERAPAAGDRRVHRLRLTALGERAMAAASVLEPARVAALLKRLRPDERARAVEGLALLAGAARRLPSRARRNDP